MVKMLQWIFALSLGVLVIAPSFAQEAATTKNVAIKTAAIEQMPTDTKKTKVTKEKKPEEASTSDQNASTPKTQKESDEDSTAKSVKITEKAAEQEKKEKPVAEETKSGETKTEDAAVGEAAADEPSTPPASVKEAAEEKPKWQEEADGKQKGKVTSSSKKESVEKMVSSAEKEKDKKVDSGADEVMGIDTIDLEDPQGNWLYKRVWWERAEAKYEKIRATVNQVFEVRTNFFAKRADLNKNILDPFYIKIGVSQGELQEIISELIARTEKMSQESRVKTIVEKAEVDKKALQELQKNVSAVVSKDEEIEKAVSMLMEQIGKIRNIEQQAWTDFKNIARVLDDRKARELFYKVDGAWRNIKDLQQYIAEPFAKSFDELIAKVKEQVNKVDQEVGAIRESGIDLKKRLLSMQATKIAPPEDEEEEELPKGILSRFIIDPAKSAFSTAWSIISWPYTKLFGSKQNADTEEEEEGASKLAEEPVAMKEAEKVTVKKTVTEAPPAEKQQEAELVEAVKAPNGSEAEAEKKEDASEESKKKNLNEEEIDKELAESDEEPVEDLGEDQADEYQEFDFELPEGFEYEGGVDLGDLSQYGE